MKYCKKHYLLFVLLIGHSTLAFTQNDSTFVPFKKNEIGVNIGPAVLVLLGNTPNSQPLGISYKRTFKHWAVRTNFSYKPNAYANSNFITENTKINDTTLIWKTTNMKSQAFIGRIGIEYRKTYKRGWSLVTGIDFQAQNSFYYKTITQATFKIDSTQNAGSAEQSYYTTLKNQKNTLEETRNAKQLGIGLTFGSIIPLHKHWYLLAQLRADGFVGPSTNKSKDFISGKTIQNKTNNFDFNIGALVSELSIYYCF